MLNPVFPRIAKSHTLSDFVISDKLAEQIHTSNESFDAGAELRLQAVYGDELWLKLNRAGITASYLNERAVLEVCVGGGFLTHHLLSRSTPKEYTANDISSTEIQAAKNLIASDHPDASIEWVLGDMHFIDFEQRFDVVIGNSFLHHFHNVPKVLTRFSDLLKPGGIFVSLHEPTPMSVVVESSKLPAYLPALIFPSLINELARLRYKGGHSATDVWLFEPTILRQVALRSGFSRVQTIPWNLSRSISTNRNGLHLSADKPRLSFREEETLRKAIRIDDQLNRFLPSRFFGSVSLVCHK